MFELWVIDEFGNKTLIGNNYKSEIDASMDAFELMLDGQCPGGIQIVPKK